MISFDELENNSFGLPREKPKRVRKPITEEKRKEKIRKRASYITNIALAKKLRGYGVPVRALYPVMIDMHHLKRYGYARNVLFAKGSIDQIKEDLENEIIKL